MELMWTEKAAAARNKLTTELRVKADKAAALIASDPEHSDSHLIPGDAVVRQLITTSGLRFTYTRVGSLLIMVVLDLFIAAVL